MDYIIVMKFITWVLIILMWIGYSFIKSCEGDLNDPDTPLDDVTLRNIEMWVEEYYSRNFIGRVAYVLHTGARVFAIFFELPNKNKE